MASNNTHANEGSTKARSILRASVPFWQPVVLSAMAGGMAWGIRGQYGHETGAMIAGLLVSLVVILVIAPGLSAATAVRAAAMTTIGIGIGGSMTYAQSIGLTQDAPMIGNLAALKWGMLGLAVKGAIWIGFAGLFLGIGLGGVRYRTVEILLLMVAMLGMSYLGIQLLNEPFDPAQKILPRIYFSQDWRWLPGATLKPRREVWGGLYFALMTGWIWAGWFKRDRLVRHMVLWAMIGGAVGFPAGQSLQSFHAWHPELFKAGIWATLDPHMNWWNMMETSFGCIMGGIIGLGLWLNRSHIQDQDLFISRSITPSLEWALALVHVPLLLMEEFSRVRIFAALYDFGLVLAFIPMIASAGGRLWPYWLLFPVTMLPIAGKTIRNLVYESNVIGVLPGWLVYGLLPVLTMIAASIWAMREAGREPRDARNILGPALLLCSWAYFGLNFAFFRFPWPWQVWTSRTPNAIIFSICIAGLTWAALRYSKKVSS